MGSLLSYLYSFLLEGGYKMKVLKGALIGAIIGSTLTISTGVFADTAKQISAYLADHIQFQFDGEYKSTPEGQAAIMYNDSVYVPARFIAENTGAEVKWDPQTKTVRINTPEPEVIEKIVYVEKEEVEEKEEKDNKEEQKEEEIEETKNRNYQTLPIKKTYKDMEITATAVISYDNETKVYFTIENTGSIPLQVQQSKTIIEVDGKSYEMNSKRASDWDREWYNDIRKDEEKQGYILFDGIPEDSKYMHIELSILQQDFRLEEIPVSFDIELENITR